MMTFLNRLLEGCRDGREEVRISPHKMEGVPTFIAQEACHFRVLTDAASRTDLHLKRRDPQMNTCMHV